MADMSWPLDMLPTGSISIRAINGRVTGPVSLAGTRQVQVGQDGHWEIGYANLPRWSAAQNRVWRAIATRLQAGETMLVPVFDAYQAPIPSGATDVIVTHDDGTSFDDDTGYLVGPVTATASGSVAQAARTMVIDLAAGDPLTAGHYFSVVHPTWDERLYMIDRIVSVDGSLYTVGFWPPAREAIPAGFDLNFSDPRCAVTLKDEDPMGDDRTAEIITRNSVSFVEVFP